MTKNAEEMEEQERKDKGWCICKEPKRVYENGKFVGFDICCGKPKARFY